MARVYDEVLDYLVDSGVDLYAGMVGSTSAPYVASLAGRPGVRYVAVRHEQVAASIVDAAARLRRRPGCLLTHGASGALAASLGVAAAAADSTPLLWLSVTQERIAMERGYWQALDVLSPMSSIVKSQTRVERADRAVDAVRTALHEAISGRPGVSQVDIPIDVSVAEYDGQAHAPGSSLVPAHRPAALEDEVAAVRELLATSARPVILVGGGAAFSDAGAEVEALAELLNAPVVNTPTSRGLVAEDHPLSLGPSGILGFAPIGEAITEADLVLAIGSRLSDLQLARTQLLPPGVAVVQVNTDPSSLGKQRSVVLEVVADARTFASQLLRLLDAEPLAVPEERREWCRTRAAAIHDWRLAWLESAPSDGRVHPQELVRALIDHLPRDTIFTHGAGNHTLYGYMAPVVFPGAHLVSARLGAMGCALGYGIGAKLARPEQAVIVCAGDGEFMLQIGDLETLVRERLAVIVVVFNNFRLGSQYDRVEAYGKVIGVEHGNPNFADLAELYGCKGYRVDSPGQFASVINEALTLDRPVVIDAIIARDSMAPRIQLTQEAR